MQVISNIIDHWVWTLYMTILTIYALFGDDIRLAATPVSVDDYFYIASIVCLVFFSLEIIAQSFVKENY